MTSLPMGSAGARRQSSSPFLPKNHPDVDTKGGGANGRREREQNALLSLLLW